MRIVSDISVWQTGEGVYNSVDLGTLAQVVSGSWVRWSDYSIYSRYGPDVHFSSSISELMRFGCPAGPYIYPAPTYSDPDTQIRAMYNDCPPIGLAPMLDPESEGMRGMRGETLIQWIEEALRVMRDLWGYIPVWYTSASFCSGNGIYRMPNVPHVLMLAEYHSTRPFTWGTRNEWESRALSYYGGPDLPRGLGYETWDVWQFTSQGNLPGVLGNCDVSLVQDHAWEKLVKPVALSEPPVKPRSKRVSVNFIPAAERGIGSHIFDVDWISGTSAKMGQETCAAHLLIRPKKLFQGNYRATVHEGNGTKATEVMLNGAHTEAIPVYSSGMASVVADDPEINDLIVQGREQWYFG